MGIREKIAVFHKGEIVQSGSHSALLAQEDGKYYELWQAQYYTESPESTAPYAANASGKSACLSKGWHTDQT